jgi:hypothetical protein
VLLSEFLNMEIGQFELKSFFCVKTIFLFVKWFLQVLLAIFSERCMKSYNFKWTGKCHVCMKSMFRKLNDKPCWIFEWNQKLKMQLIKINKNWMSRCRIKFPFYFVNLGKFASNFQKSCFKWEISVFSI